MLQQQLFSSPLPPLFAFSPQVIFVQRGSASSPLMQQQQLFSLPLTPLFAFCLQFISIQRGLASSRLAWEKIFSWHLPLLFSFWVQVASARMDWASSRPRQLCSFFVSLHELLLPSFITFVVRMGSASFVDQYQVWRIPWHPMLYQQNLIPSFRMDFHLPVRSFETLASRVMGFEAKLSDHFFWPDCFVLRQY